ncbi:FxLYD domain-containing protein [Erythrobacter sp. MTPC3]|uniref:FxLYD domain-containing protein n=1 Tax=Erythrobacter sp. MTPC3 TaxID=3056564 RepID=UPI0036F25894
MPDSAIGIEGRTVRCAKCKHSWFQDPQPLDLTEKADETPSAATPAPSPAPTEASPSPERAEPEAGPAPTPSPAPAPTPPAETAAPSVNHWRTPDSVKAPYSRPQGVDPVDPVAGGIAARALRQGLTNKDRGETEKPFAEEPVARPIVDEPSEPVADPLADQHADAETGDDADYHYPYEDEDTEAESGFDYSPPFSARRNPLKMWTIAAAAFALLATGTVFAVNYYGLPSWVPIQQPTFGIGNSDLTLDFPVEGQRTETLETGAEIFRVRGTITNDSQETVTVPSLLVVFSDERGRQVGTWPIVPSQRELAPGESMNVTQAIADVPAAARLVEIGWAPN